jgi:hypothetical protein
VTISPLSRVSWAAVFAGVVITLVVQALLTLLGIGIGAATIDPWRQSQTGSGLGIGAAIWFLVSTLIAVYVGAMVAGRMSGATRRFSRTLHGLLTWGASAIIGVLCLTTSAGTLLGGAGALMGGASAMSGNTQGNANTAAMSATSRPTSSSTTGRDTGNQGDEQQARASTDKAARRVSQAALWSFAVLVLSGVVSGFGASPQGDESEVKLESAPR